jgi:hypothetical protein
VGQARPEKKPLSGRAFQLHTWAIGSRCATLECTDSDSAKYSRCRFCVIPAKFAPIGGARSGSG